MNWKLFKAFPKYSIALAMAVISTVWFAGWWIARKSDSGKRWQENRTARHEEVQRRAAALPKKLGWLVLVGRDLYDISSGELIFKDWLSGVPLRMFYQPTSNRLMVLTERGVIRFALDGTKDGEIGTESPPVYTHDGSQVMFVKDGDIWVARMDWDAFRYENPRQVTKYGQFKASFFAANTLTATDKAIITREGNQQLRIDLLTGNVKPGRAPVGDIIKRRSPDGRTIVGDDGTNVYAYDVDANQSQTFPKGRDHAGDFQWLGNEACAVLLAGTKVSLYDRKSGTFKAIASLPFQCDRISRPSPEGGFVLCSGRHGTSVVNLRTGSAETLNLANSYFWTSEGTLLCSRDVPDTKKRGTWIATIGGSERQIIPDPFTFARNGQASATLMPELGTVVFRTKDALYRMKPDGAELQEIAKITGPTEKIQAIEIWGVE